MNSVITRQRQDFSRGAEFWAGFRATFPLVVGAAPFGMIFGALAGKISLPDSVWRALRYVPAAVLMAIIVPATVYPAGGELNLTAGNAYLAAALISVAIAWRSGNLLLTILLGMVSFWGWRLFF